MTRRNASIALVASLVLGATAFLALTSNDARAQHQSFAANSVYRLSGDFDVEFVSTFSRDGDRIPPGEQGGSRVTDVHRIDLLEDWAILTKRRASRDVTFVVPRDRVVYINATE